MANRATLKQIATVASTALTADKIGSLSYVATYNEITNCLEKIGKQFTIKSNFTPKLSELDGEFLPYGKTVEEFYANLPSVRAYDPEGKNALSPAYPHFAAASWNYTIPKKTVKVTESRDRIESSCLSGEAFGAMTASIMQGLEDAVTLYKNELKRELLGRVAEKVVNAQGSDSKTFAVSTAYKVGTLINNGTTYAVVQEDIAASNTTTFADLLANGTIIALDMVTTLAKPTDTATGEAFIESIKKAAEEATDAVEGKCINGHAVESPSLVLYILHGIMPNIDVNTLAGAFNADKLALPVEVRRCKDFGTDCPANVYAILMDSRGASLMPNHDTVDSDRNGEGEFTNFYRHVGYTAVVSRNTYTKIYKAS